ncbi:2OG-Fe(II) oxygenase [Schlesneria sp. T3-172]|uniref:2OG-Fe(II) oxygenase n=1 Tax=Schlesneria sphaerica TaxID=3373610 RepID=UPI0037CA34AA
MRSSMKELERILNSLGESSRFATSGQLPAVLPGLEVDGFGSVGLPLAAVEAKRLIQQAEQAPYGRGEETIVDTDVRRVWQFEPTQFRLKNTDWATQIETAVEQIRRDFGLDQKISAHLYKLLVYEKGSFFAPHRDTEKIARMFATLVVCLPSLHEGGSLIVQHDGQTETIDFGGTASEFQTRFAAFYADCQHEVTPVTSGFRICLVYNLSLSGRRQPSAPRNQPLVQQARQELENLFENASNPMEKICIPLRHQYTEANLDPRQLKGEDRTRFDVLRQAAESLGYPCYLALLTHWQSGEADYDSLDTDRYWGRSSRRRRYRYDDNDEADDTDVELGEVHDEDLSLAHWLNPDGEPQPFGKIEFQEEEVLGFDEKKDWSRRQEVHEATGNEGVTVECWYHQAAVVIWPPSRFFQIMASGGPSSSVPALEQMMAASPASDQSSSLREFAKQIIAQWNPDWKLRNDKVSLATRMLELLDRIGDAELAVRFVRDVLPQSFNGSEGKALTRLCHQFGWDVLGPSLLSFVVQQQPEDHMTTIARIVAVCAPLCCDPPKPTKKRLQVCQSLATELWSAVKRFERKLVGDEDDDLWIEEGSWNDPARDYIGLVDPLLLIGAAVEAADELERFLDRILLDPRRYNLRRVLVPDLLSAQKWLPRFPAGQPALTRLREHCLVQLRAATTEPVEPPKDWTRSANFDCHCDVCQTLAKFLRDPKLQVGRFPLRKDRRQHLHNQIERHHCDCTHETERKGSPQTLVCNKTNATYTRQRQQYENDLKLITKLEALTTPPKPRKPRKKPQ